MELLLWVRVELEVMPNEGILHIPQSSRTETSLSDGFVLYPEFTTRILLLCRDAIPKWVTT